MCIFYITPNAQDTALIYSMLIKDQAVNDNNLQFFEKSLKFKQKRKSTHESSNTRKSKRKGR